MHSTFINHTDGIDDEWYGGTGFIVHHNGDYSGDVKIVLPTKLVETFENPESRAVVNIPFRVLKELVGQYVQSMLISQLEQGTGEGLIDSIRT